MIKKKICIALALVACFCVGVVAILQITSTKEHVLAESTTYAATDFKMVEEASVRSDSAHNGIRFSTFIGKDSPQGAANYWETHEMATLFIPKSALGEKTLTIGATYSGLTPVVATFNGNVETLGVDSNYPNGRVFNAVLELTSFVNNTKALNGTIVARTYYKDTTTGEVEFLDPVEYAPALAAAETIEGGEENSVLTKYVSKVEVSDKRDRNGSTSEPIALEMKTNVEGLEVNYKATSGNVIGNQYTGTTAGTDTVKASVIGGIYQDTFKVYVLADESLERKYYAEKDSHEVLGNADSVSRNNATEYLTFNVREVDGVKYNGATLLEGLQYTKSNGSNGIKIINIEKAKLATSSSQVGELTFVSEEYGDATIHVNLSYGGEDSLTEALDYSDSNKQFDILSYYAIRTSALKVDDDGVKGGNITESTSSINFVSEKYIADFYDAGYGGLLTQSAGNIGNTTQHPTLESATNLYATMEMAHAMGQDGTVMVTDGLLWAWVEECYNQKYSAYPLNWMEYSTTTYPVPTLKDVGYAGITADNFLGKVRESLARYIHHPAFGGIVLHDEPGVIKMPLVAEIYKAVKTVYEENGLTDKKIIANLSPYYNNSGHYNTPGTADRGDGHEAYRAYIKMWFDLSDADEVQVDIYSLYSNGLGELHIPCLQIMAEEALKNDAKISIINSSWQRVGTERFHTYEDMAWMNNITLAYGAYDFGYYTYHTLNDETNQVVINGASPITRDGKKTEIYDYVREINNKAQIFAPVILNFDYVKGSVYTAGYNKTYTNTAKDYASDYMNKKSYAKLTSVVANDSVNAWLVNELKDNDKGNYMYAVMNIIDTIKNGTDYNVGKSITLTFNSAYSKAWVYFDGQFSVMSLTSDKKLTLSDVKPGECYYVIPF